MLWRRFWDLMKMQNVRRAVFRAYDCFHNITPIPARGRLAAGLSYDNVRYSRFSLFFSMNRVKKYRTIPATRENTIPIMNMVFTIPMISVTFGFS